MNVITGITCSNCGAHRPEDPGACANCGDTRRTFHDEIKEGIVASDSFGVAIRRGPQSWAYIRMVAGLLLGITLAVVGVLDIPGGTRAIAMICLSVIIITTLLYSETLHDLLLRHKASYEDKSR